MSQDKPDGITLNGPAFGVVMTIIAWLFVIGYIFGCVITGGMLLVLTIFIVFGVLLGALVFYLLWELTLAFYRWASRGFRPKPGKRTHNY
jgi:hypothetical protein